MKINFAIAAGLALALSASPSFAAEKEKAPSTIDKGSQSGDQATSPKTTGAMNKATDSVATSPQDVGAQQKGEKTAAEGGGDRPGAPKIDEKQVSPGTVGAAPGTGGKADAK